MLIKIILTVIFLLVTIGVGVYSRKQAKSVDGFVLGGRSVGPWLTAFAFGTSYFSAVVFVGYAGQFGWKYGLSASWIGIGNAIIGSVFLFEAPCFGAKHLHVAILNQPAGIIVHHLDDTVHHGIPRINEKADFHSLLGFLFYFFSWGN